MDTIACILNRRSVRRFTDQSIEPEKMALLVEAVRRATSWRNTQCRKVFVITNSEDKAAEWQGKKRIWQKARRYVRP